MLLKGTDSTSRSALLCYTLCMAHTSGQGLPLASSRCIIDRRLTERSLHVQSMQWYVTHEMTAFSGYNTLNKIFIQDENCSALGP